jgi:hypothetical protein
MRCHTADRNARRRPNGRRANSRKGSVYVVVPKMHGPKEVAFARDLHRHRGTPTAWRATPSRWASWTRSAAPRSTSRSASALPAKRVFFINTGFLDRTGDEIHTSMEAGPMIRKGDMKRPPGSMPTKLECGYRVLNAACRACPDRQGHVGHAGHDGRHAGAEDRHPRPGANTPGCRRPPPPRCTPRTITGECRRFRKS